MQSKRYWTIGIAVVVVLIIAGGAYWYVTRPAPATVTPFPLNAADGTINWNFKGAYAGSATATAEAEADKTKQEALLGKNSATDYELYISIGNDDTLLGDGLGAYDAYDHASALYPNQGLPFDNLGNLFAKMGANHTAADAYAKAVETQLGMLQYHLDRLKFLTTAFPKDQQGIAAAFADAAGQFGDNPSVLTIEAQWLEGEGKYANAVAAWQKVKQLLAAQGEDTAAIDAQIARDMAKE